MTKFGRAISLAILLATRLRAVDSDFRAGLWEGTMDRGGGIERIVLLLTVSVHGKDGPDPVTDAAARLESGSGTCESKKAEIEPYRVVFECMTVKKRYGADSAGGHFEAHFSPGSSLATGTWRGEPVQLTRPQQASSLTAGDWVAEGAGQTCVVRIFDGDGSRSMRNGAGATIDIYSKERAVFGKQIDSNWGPFARIRFFWTDSDKNSFLGSLSTDGNEATGQWQGSDFLCGTPGLRITFHRTRSSL